MNKMESFSGRNKKEVSWDDEKVLLLLIFIRKSFNLFFRPTATKKKTSNPFNYKQDRQKQKKIHLR